MKTKYFFTALMMLAVTVGIAQNGNESKLVVVNQKLAGTFKVIYQGEKTGKVKMTIYNDQNQVVFTESTPKVSGFVRPVNLVGMAAGTYTIEVSGPDGREIQKVSYNLPTAVNRVHVARISESGKYLLSVGDVSTDQINVRIFDGNNNLVHSEDLQVAKGVGLVYNLKGVNGLPTFEVTDKGGNVKTIRY